MSLYQRVRPTKLNELRGNEPTVKLLNKVVRQPADRRPHVFLLTGPSGCGKTTIARILSNEFECHEADIFEFNAANTNGIDTIREVSKKVHLRPIGGEAKAYIFDESHQLTSSAQEGLLKVLEETPNYCYFFLCTTEPESVIKTIQNRCTRYEVYSLAQQDVFNLLMDACEKEKLTVAGDLLMAIIDSCEGSPRKALMSLEQVKDMDSVEDALKILATGTERDVQIIEMCKLMYMNPSKRRSNWKRIITTYDAIGEDAEKIRRSILGFLYKKLVSTNDEKTAVDLTRLLRLFSTSVYYGGKSHLGALIARACFEIEFEKGE